MAGRERRDNLASTLFGGFLMVARSVLFAACILFPIGIVDNPGQG